MTRAGEGSPQEFVVSKNLHRRQLTTSQRQMVAARMADAEWGGDRHPDRQPANSHVRFETTIPEIAKLFNVGLRGIEHARAILREGIQ